jgi:hypothetical protein
LFADADSSKDGLLDDKELIAVLNALPTATVTVGPAQPPAKPEPPKNPDPK